MKKSLTRELDVVGLNDGVFLVWLTMEYNNTAVLTSIREVEGVEVKEG